MQPRRPNQIGTRVTDTSEDVPGGLHASTIATQWARPARVLWREGPLLGSERSALEMPPSHTMGPQGHMYPVGVCSFCVCDIAHTSSGVPHGPKATHSPRLQIFSDPRVQASRLPPSHCHEYIRSHRREMEALWPAERLTQGRLDDTRHIDGDM